MIFPEQLKKQRIKVTSNEQNITSNEQKVKSNEQKLASNEQRATNKMFNLYLMDDTEISASLCTLFQTRKFLKFLVPESL